MEAVKDQSSSDVTNNNSTLKSKLRYPLRSASKPSKDDIPTRSPATKSGRSASNVSKSVSVLDLSSKEKSAKPPRRLSIPTKSTVSPLPKTIGTITPISENRIKRSNTGQGKNGTPSSDISKSTNQRKFSVLHSASYWLSQIKLSESAAKHSISLGFFKLALESGCEPLQKMRDELKSYACRHNLVELGEPLKELLRSYNIPEDLEQLQVSETLSQAPGEGTRSSDEEVHSSTSITATRKFKPKSLNSESFQASSVAELGKKESSQKRTPANQVKGSSKTNAANLKSVTNTGGAKSQKKSEKLSRQEAKNDKTKLEEGKISTTDKDLIDASAVEKEEQEDKENLDAEQMEEMSMSEVV